MEHKDLELRISAQTADGITVGLIEYLPPSTPKKELYERIDMLVDVVSRQRAKTVLVGEEQALARDEAQPDPQVKHRAEQTAKNATEAKDRSSGKATSTGVMALQNIETTIKALESNIEQRKKGIESLKKLTE